MHCGVKSIIPQGEHNIIYKHKRTRRKCQSTQVVSSTNGNKLTNLMLTSSVRTSDRYLRETRGHPVGFLVFMLVLVLVYVLVYVLNNILSYISGLCTAAVELHKDNALILRFCSVPPVGIICDLCYQSFFHKDEYSMYAWCL